MTYSGCTSECPHQQGVLGECRKQCEGVPGHRDSHFHFIGTSTHEHEWDRGA